MPAFLVNGSACGQNGIVAVSLSTKLRWFRRSGLIASTLGKEFAAPYVCPICDRAFDLPPIIARDPVEDQSQDIPEFDAAF